MTIILWIIASPFIFIFSLYLFFVAPLLLLAVIVRGLQFVGQKFRFLWPVIPAGVFLWLILAVYYSTHTLLERAAAELGVLALILMLVDKFMGFPEIGFKKKPKPGTALDTMEARVLRTIRARHPLMCLNSTYGDLEQQPCFTGDRYRKIVGEAWKKVHGDCQEKFEESITLATALRTIDGILEYETQQVRPIVREYLEAAGEKAVNVIDIRK